MNLEILTALALFSLVSSITPGPNNLMLMASGANYGLRRTLPHMSGVCLGFTFMVALVGFGLMQVFDLYPLSYTILKVVSITYLLYLSWKIATASPPGASEPGTGSKPMTFLQAVLFQWVNPKAWTMALTAISLYAPDRTLMAVLLVAMVFGLVNLPCISLWTILGRELQRVLRSAWHVSLFNGLMASLLVLSVLPTLFL